MNKRLFIAVPLPDYARFELEKAAGALEEPLRGSAKIAAPENWHFTLVFLGDTDERDIPKVEDALRAAAVTQWYNSIELYHWVNLEIERVAYWPSERNPRMVWFLGNIETSRILGAIADNLKLELKGRGIHFSDDHAQFSAHITYARLRQPALRRQLRQGEGSGGQARLSVRIPHLKPVSFPIEEVVLFESHLGLGGSQYDEIFTIGL